MIMFAIIRKKNRLMRFSNVIRTCVSYKRIIYVNFFFCFILISSKDKTDIDIIRSEHRFLWNEDEDDPEESW